MTETTQSLEIIQASILSSLEILNIHGGCVVDGEISNATRETLGLVEPLYKARTVDLLGLDYRAQLGLTPENEHFKDCLNRANGMIYFFDNGFGKKILDMESFISPNECAHIERESQKVTSNFVEALGSIIRLEMLKNGFLDNSRVTEIIKNVHAKFREAGRR